MGIKPKYHDSPSQMHNETCRQGDILLRNWLNYVSKMAILNGVNDFHFSNEVVQALAYAYHVKFTPIEAVAFLRLVANKRGDDDPDKVREVELRAQDLMLIARPDEDYDAGLVRQHVSRFVEIATPHERQPEHSRSISFRQLA